MFQGKQKTARQFYEKALAIDPNHYQSLLGLANLLPTKSEERLEAMERATAIQPNYATLMEIVDFYRSVRSDSQRAYDICIEARELRPRDGEAYHRLSDICREMGRDKEAREWNDKWQDVYATKRKVGRSANE